MARVIVVTNFSAASRNALDYTCRLINSRTTSILLLNIYIFPGSITGDPISLAAMNETIANDARRLDAELEWASFNYPQVNIRAEMATGVFIEELNDAVAAGDTALIVMGTEGKYSELLSWDANIIDAFVDQSTPVLIIPEKVRFRPLEKIAFALNYYRTRLHVPVQMVRKLVQFTKAKLYVVNVVPPDEVITDDANQRKAILKSSLEDLSPEYYEPAYENVIQAIDRFTADEKIDMLIVIPSRHGIWYNIFQKSHTRGIVHLNNLPVVSLHREGDFIE